MPRQAGLWPSSQSHETQVTTRCHSIQEQAQAAGVRAGQHPGSMEGPGTFLKGLQKLNEDQGEVSVPDKRNNPWEGPHRQNPECLSNRSEPSLGGGGHSEGCPPLIQGCLHILAN